jgi:hypothetical protein
MVWQAARQGGATGDSKKLRQIGDTGDDGEPGV